MKIFVSIVSYRDPLLPLTLKSLMDNKSQLTDVTYGIFEQTKLEDSLEGMFPELANHPKVKYKRIDPEHSDGVCWARHINGLQLEDEDFYYQVDSHMLFNQGWDRHLIRNYKLAYNKFNTEKIIIASNCGNFIIGQDGNPWIEDHGEVSCKAGYWTFQQNYVANAHGSWYPATQDVTPAIHIFAGNMFTHADWLKNVGNNPYIFFDGEEQYLTLASFAAGYHICHSTTIECYHLRDTISYVTKPHVDQVISEEKLAYNKERGLRAFHKFLGTVDDEVFEEYRKYSGVDYINRKLENRAIDRSNESVGIFNDWEIPDRDPSEPVNRAPIVNL